MFIRWDMKSYHDDNNSDGKYNNNNNTIKYSPFLSNSNTETHRIIQRKKKDGRKFFLRKELPL